MISLNAPNRITTQRSAGSTVYTLLMPNRTTSIAPTAIAIPLMLPGPDWVWNRRNLRFWVLSPPKESAKLLLHLFDDFIQVGRICDYCLSPQGSLLYHLPVHSRPWLPSQL